jgi:hypothetical protein
MSRDGGNCSLAFLASMIAINFLGSESLLDMLVDSMAILAEVPGSACIESLIL